MTDDKRKPRPEDLLIPEDYLDHLDDGPVPLDPDADTSHLMGLARTIAKAGYATRRQAEELVRAGRVQVDGRRVLDPGQGVGDDNEVRIDDRKLVEVIRTYLAFHKPLNVATGSTVTHRTQLITEFLPRDIRGLAPAGRLDPATSGLLLVSNDASWNALAASGHGFDKEFIVEIEGEVTEIQLSLIAAGVQVPKTGMVKPRSITLMRVEEEISTVKLVLREGKVRSIRNLFLALRLSVRSIHRQRIGPVSVEGVSAGRWRVLSSQEVEAIRNGSHKSFETILKGKKS